MQDAEDHLIKSVTFTDGRGNEYGPFTSMSSLYDIINLKVVNYPVGAAPPFDEVGEKIQTDTFLPDLAKVDELKPWPEEMSFTGS